MNRKQKNILLLAVIAFVFWILVNIFLNLGRITSFFSSNSASTTLVIDHRPMLAEFAITAIVFGAMFVMFKPRKKKG